MDKPFRESEYLVAWLAFFAATSVVGFILGGLIGVPLGIVMGAAAADPRVIQLVGGIIGFLVGIPVSYLFFRLVVGRLVVGKLVERTQAAAAQGAPPVPFGGAGTGL